MTEKGLERERRKGKREIERDDRGKMTERMIGKQRRANVEERLEKSDRKCKGTYRQSEDRQWKTELL